MPAIARDHSTMNPVSQLRPIALGWLLCAASAVGTASAQDRATAPRVTATQPENGATNVTLDLKEVTVTFDQDMNPRGFSFVGGGPTFPQMRGRPFWRTARECVLPVELSPGHSYFIGINSERFTNFMSAAGIAATPLTLRFSTPPDTRTPPAVALASQAEAARRLREAIEMRYSHRQSRLTNWTVLWLGAEPRLVGARSPREFAEIAGEMLASTRDPHLWFDVGGEVVPAFRRRVTPNVSPALLPKLVSQWTAPNRIVARGWAAPQVGYLAIHSWDRSHGREAFDPAFKALQDFREIPALILDLRLNSGGDELIAREFAGCFVERRALYARHLTVDPSAPGGFGPLVERWVAPAAGHPRYPGKVAMLVGPAVMSSAEAFVLMMRQVPGVRLIGQRTYGSSGNPKPHPLGNGVTVFLPSWKEYAPDGTAIEGNGIAPDVEVTSSTETQPGRDTTLDAAVEELRRVETAGH
jgi:hypothetical protein